jgi:hypothetical protein
METPPNPVAAVLGMSRNPIAYVTPNASSVIDRSFNGDSDSSGTFSVSNLSSPRAMIFPLTFDTLIDHGLSTILISKEYICKLGLHCKHIHKPYTAKLAMENNGQKVEVKFSKYVKLQLHDPSSYWSLKTAHAIVAPGLCSPMILRLPFLLHNNIVVDASTHTCYCKKMRFQFVTSCCPCTTPSHKKKLRMFFKELQEDQKLMVTKLNMGCHDRLQGMQYQFEKVNPVDPIAVVRRWIEVLVAQNELLHLGDQMKYKFKEVFSEIPHIDDMPMDVYCHSKMHQNVYRHVHTALPENTVKPGQR